MENINGYKLTFDENVQKILNNYDENKYSPIKENLFKALELTSFSDVKVVILGQDPYPTKGDANGLSFSVNRSEKLPKSLNNMFKELESDLGIKRTNGDLTTWAMQGVLLLNTVLSVEVGKANSHRNLGWEELTTKIIKDVASKKNIVFVLLGKQAQSYKKMIFDENIIIETSHPSPLSAYRGFLGSKIYSQINFELQKLGHSAIKW